MTMSLAVLYTTFLIGVGVLVAALVWGDMPEHEQRLFGMTPLRPDLRHVLVMPEILGVPEVSGKDIYHTPAAPLERHA